jgi:hypothetical protein
MSTLFVRLGVSGRTVFVAVLAMFESGSRMLLGLLVLTEIVMMGRLMMMRRSVEMGGGLVVVLTRRMLW